MKKHTSFPFIFYFLILLQTLSSLSFYMVAPLITKYLTYAGSTLAVAGLISGILSYVCLVVRPFSGLLADRINPRFILIVSLAVFGSSIIGYGLSKSVILFAVFRIISGISFAFSSTTIFAYAGNFIPEKRMGEGVGYLGMGNIFSSAVGPMLGSFLAGQFGYGISFTMAGLMSIFPGVILLLWRQESPLVEEEKFHMEEKRKKIRFRDIFAWELIPIAILAALFSYTNSTMSNFLLLYAELRGIAQASLYFSFLAMFLVILRPLTGKVNDRYGLGSVLIPGYLLTILGVCLIANAKSLWMLLAASGFMAFGQGGGQPAVQTECMKRLGAARRGVATSTYYIFNDIAQGLAPTVGGILAGSFGYLAVFAVCVCLFAAGLVYYLGRIFFLNSNNSKFL
ncbi:MAG: MFS transporter [Lachnospiraceae bacterium]|nr:MFS transporter [Lachnospiraceae bacterium]MBD5456145.1 MFS transporter [Lachnospiraceae bacterium]